MNTEATISFVESDGKSEFTISLSSAIRGELSTLISKPLRWQGFTDRRIWLELPELRAQLRVQQPTLFNQHLISYLSPFKFTMPLMTLDNMIHTDDEDMEKLLAALINILR